MEGAPDGLMFEAGTMTATEEAAFFKVIKEIAFRAVPHARSRRKAACRSLWRSLAFWFGENEADIRVPARSEGASRAGQQLSPVAYAHRFRITRHRISTRSRYRWHRDSPPFGIIVGISLGAVCRMRFQLADGKQRQT
jgi:hypothetical protein